MAASRKAIVNEDDLIGDVPQFFQFYLDMLNSSDELVAEVQTNLKDPSFRRKIQSLHTDARLVREVAPYTKMMLRKPQKLLVDNPDYYVAIDAMTNTFYICYRNLIMLDIDLYKDDADQAIENYLPHCLCQIQQVIDDFIPLADDSSEPTARHVLWKAKKCLGKENCKLRYRVYKSRNGYHAFIISHELNAQTDLGIQLMLEAMSDYFYTIFCFLRGCCVRLNIKPGEQHLGKDIYPYYGDVVHGKKVPRGSANPHLEELTDLHIRLCEVFKVVKPCITHNLG